MKTVLSSRAPVDASQWSRAGQRRLGYLSPPRYYEDRVFACRSCQCESVFTAAQQKHEFEVKKAHPLRQHVLCQSCLLRKREIQEINARYLACWNESTEHFAKDVTSMLLWLAALQELPTFGARRDSARIRMLQRLIHDAA
jgi:hypothetical protein